MALSEKTLDRVLQQVQFGVMVHPEDVREILEELSLYMKKEAEEKSKLRMPADSGDTGETSSSD